MVFRLSLSLHFWHGIHEEKTGRFQQAYSRIAFSAPGLLLFFEHPKVSYLTNWQPGRYRLMLRPNSSRIDVFTLSWDLLEGTINRHTGQTQMERHGDDGKTSR